MAPKSSTQTHQTTLVIVGSGGVGKSCLTVMFLKKEFLSEYDPTIEENYRKKINTDGVETTVDIVDTAGQQEYSSLRDSHLRTGEGFMLCFAINDQNSFVELKELHSAILRLRDNNSKTPCVVVACKCDLEGERDVDVATAKAWSDSIKAPFIETSAKTNKNVDEAFHLLVSEVRKLTPNKQGSGSSKKKSGCILL